MTQTINDLLTEELDSTNRFQSETQMKNILKGGALVWELGDNADFKNYLPKETLNNKETWNTEPTAVNVIQKALSSNNSNKWKIKGRHKWQEEKSLHEKNATKLPKSLKRNVHTGTWGIRNPKQPQPKDNIPVPSHTQSTRNPTQGTKHPNLSEKDCESYIEYVPNLPTFTSPTFTALLYEIHRCTVWDSLSQIMNESDLQTFSQKRTRL